MALHVYAYRYLTNLLHRHYDGDFKQTVKGFRAATQNTAEQSDIDNILGPKTFDSLGTPKGYSVFKYDKDNELVAAGAFAESDRVVFSIGYFDTKNGGVVGEDFSITFDSKDAKGYTLRVHNGAMPAFAYMPELIQALSEYTTITPDDLETILQKLEFQKI